MRAHQERRSHVGDFRLRTKLRVENLEDRLTPSWTGIPPSVVPVPTSFTAVTLNSSGDASGAASIATTEVDWYKFTATTAGSYTFTASTPQSSVDTVIGLFNASGQRVAYNDDIDPYRNTDSRRTVSIAAGTYYFGVTNYTGSAGGSYVWGIDGPSAPSTSPGTFQVAAQSYQVSEGSASLTVTVNRVGGSTGAATVSYSTANGSAVAGSDYTTTSGTLNFADGQTSATVVIPITNDTTVESTETFTLGLSNPTGGATVGSPAATTVSIIDNDVSPPPPPPPPTGGFSITLRTTGMTASQQTIFQQAADRWAQIITGDLPDAVYGGIAVDDVLIDASSVFIDGSGGTLGQAGPDRLRSGSLLPYHGIMQFDSADLASMEASGGLYYVIMHEMGHVLGVGTIWGQKGLRTGAGTSNPLFIGANAVAEYNAIFGTSATGVPLENSGGSGTRDAHWRESIFGRELMTGYLNGGVNPLSRVTVASLADLGYVVNMNAADSYSPGGGSLVGGGGGGGSGGGGGAGLRAALPPGVSAALAPVFSNSPDWASDLGANPPAEGGWHATADWIERVADRFAGAAADLDLAALPVPAFDPFDAFDTLAGLA